MGNIVVKEKPNNISFDEIHKVLESAHKNNIANGIIMKTASLSGEELEKRIGDDGVCFVALDGEKIVGTLSLRFVERNTWYAKGLIPDYILAGVIPEYQGMHINSMLANKVFEFAKSRGYEVIELDTDENNTNAINIYKHQGFRLVGYHAFKGVSHYSAVMVKWLDKAPYSKFYCKLRFLIRRFIVRLRYKVGRVKRFGI